MAKTVTITSLTFGFGEEAFAFPVRVLSKPEGREETFDPKEVCAQHKTGVSYIVHCPECDTVIPKAVKGTPAKRAPKLRRCPNEECGLEIGDRVTFIKRCRTCKAEISRGQIATGYEVNGKLLVPSPEQFAALEKLALKEPTIRLRDALAEGELPSPLFTRDVHQLAAHESAPEAFSAFAAAMVAQNYQFRADVALRADRKQLSLRYEHGGLVMADRQKRVLLVTLYGNNEAGAQDAGLVETTQAQRVIMARLQRALAAPFGNPDGMGYSTSAVDEMHRLLKSLAGGKSEPLPQPQADQTAANVEITALSPGLRDLFPVRAVKRTRKPRPQAAQAVPPLLDDPMTD